MARPKKSDRDAMATVRIEDAFWKLLGEMSYSDITVLRISQESGTNRNSFYYHYKSIDDLARSAFMNNVDTEVSGVLFSALLSGADADNNGTAPVFGTELLIHARRIMLCAGSDSSFLNRLVKDLLIRELLHRDVRIYGQPGLDIIAPEGAEQLARIRTGILAGFEMETDHLGPGLGEPFKIFLGIDDHKMDIHRFQCLLGNGLDHRETE